MARPTQTQLRQRGSFAKTYLFDVQLIDIPAGIIAPDNAFWLVQSTDIPKKEPMQTIDIQLSATRIKETGIQYDSQEFNMVMINAVDNITDDMWTSWQERASQSDTGQSADRLDIEGTFLIRQLDGQERPIISWTLEGAFPIDYDPIGGQLDGSNSDVSRPAIQLVYQRFTKDGKRASIR